MHLFVAVSRQVALKHFPHQSERPELYRIATRRRLELLRKLGASRRSAFRVDASGALSDEVTKLAKQKNTIISERLVAGAIATSNSKYLKDGLSGKWQIFTQRHGVEHIEGYGVRKRDCRSLPPCQPSRA